MNIKRLTIDDIEVAVELARTFKGETENEILKRFLSDNNNYLIGAFDNDKPVAMAIAYKLDRVDNKGPMLYMHEIEVKEEYRSQGIGKRIMEMLNGIRRDNNFHEMFLITDKSNFLAMKLYSHTGGRPTRDDDVIFVFE